MIPYIGGKSKIANWVIAGFPENYSKLTYCEVFGGGGWVLFRKEPSFLEIYNDLNSDLVNLFRTIRDNYEVFAHKAEWTLHSREMYNEAVKELQGGRPDETERAISFATHRIQSFAGTGHSWGYQIRAHSATSGQWLPFLKRMELISARLKKVQIECLDFTKVIEKYDTPDTLFYCDPPYVASEKYYDVEFGHKEHLRLASLLKEIKGRFVLSYYENDLVRDLYGGFNITSKETVKSSKGCTRNSRERVRPGATELLITNF